MTARYEKVRRDLRACPNCHADVTAAFSHSTLGPICPICQRPLRSRPRSRGRTTTDDLLLRDPCSYCGRGAGTIDHIDPRARGGSKSSAANRTAACRRCNLAKGDEPLLLYLLAR